MGFSIRPTVGDSYDLLLKKLEAVFFAQGASHYPVSMENSYTTLKRLVQNTEELVDNGVFPAPNDTENRLWKKLLTNVATWIDVDPGVPTVFHLLIIGQSNAVGVIEFATDQSPVAGGLMFNGGVSPGGAGLTSLVTLVDNPDQTIAPTLAAWLRANAGSDNYEFLVSNVAVDAAPYTSLMQGTVPYNNSLAQVTAAKSLAEAAGKQYVFLGICCIHGESDDTNVAYQSDLIDWQANYDTDIKAITGQANDVLFYAVQQTAYRFDQNGKTPPLYLGSSQTQLLNAAISEPTKIKIIGPQYMFDYADLIHHTTADRRWQGEQFAVAIYQDHFGAGYTPFIPLSATLSGSDIDIEFQVPTPPLQFNFSETMYRSAKGFTYWDDVGLFATISSVNIVGPTTVRVTLAAPPTGANQRIMYAGFPVLDVGPPKLQGTCGNLTDSTTGVSLREYNLVRFCPNFNLPVT